MYRARAEINDVSLLTDLNYSMTDDTISPHYRSLSVVQLGNMLLYTEDEARKAKGRYLSAFANAITVY